MFMVDRLKGGKKMSYIDDLLEKEDLVSPGISACQGCAAELSLRTALKILGENTIVGIPPGCMAGAGCVGWNYKSGLKIPVHIPLLGNTAALLTGVKRMYENERKDLNVVAFAGDGATADCGFQSLSAALERGENIIYICYDNEGYMNTGFQRSGTTTKGSYTSTTPYGSYSKGKEQHGKNIPLIMAMHDASYVATLSPAYMLDFTKKIEKAMGIKEGMVYLHIFSPCPTGWRFTPDKTIEVARKAVKTNFFPLFEAERGEIKLNMQISNPEPVSSFLKLLGKFQGIDKQTIEEIQENVNKNYNKLIKLSN